MTERTAIRILLSTLFLVVLMRVFGAAILPIMDSHEARYSEIARKMVELGQYLVPMSTYELPFWGKPPLSFWMTALSANLFGFHELALR